MANMKLTDRLSLWWAISGIGLLIWAAALGSRVSLAFAGLFLASGVVELFRELRWNPEKS